MLPHGDYTHSLQQDVIRKTLRESHRIRVRMHIHDPDERKLASVDFAGGVTRMLSGSVTVDATSDVKRSLSAVILDPTRSLSFKPFSPRFAGLWAEYHISVTYGVLVQRSSLYPHKDLYANAKTFPGDPSSQIPRAGVWVDFPIFWGPLTNFEGSGHEVTIEAQGKESLGLAPHYYTRKAKQLHENVLVHNAIHAIFDPLGEMRYRLPKLHYKLGTKRVLHRQSEPWKVLAGGETDADGNEVPGIIQHTGKHPHHCFYDGKGRLTVSRINKEPSFHFTEAHLTSEPDISYDATEFVNHIVVFGGKPKGKGKQPVSGSASLPPTHPLSPQALARNGKPQFITHFVAAPSLKTEKACRERAHHLLKHFAKFGVQVSFESLPIPMLEEFDVVALNYAGTYIEFPLRQFTIPLTHDSPMSIGATMRTATQKRKRKDHRHHRHHHHRHRHHRRRHQHRHRHHRHHPHH